MAVNSTVLNEAASVVICLRLHPKCAIPTHFPGSSIHQVQWNVFLSRNAQDCAFKVPQAFLQQTNIACTFRNSLYDQDQECQA